MQPEPVVPKQGGGGTGEPGARGKSIASRIALPLAIVLAGAAAFYGARFWTMKRSAQGDLVAIAGGSFAMGSEDGDEDERPVHTARVGAFAIMKTEVTLAQYRACTLAEACPELAPNHDNCNAGERGSPNHPVNCVTFAQASAYCAWARMRLPTEEEWEFAARGTDKRKYPWGAEPPDATICWNHPNERRGTCAAGSHPSDKSPFGVLDMGGGVQEWTATKYCDYKGNNCKEGVRVTRGGSWDVVDGEFLRASYRDWVPEVERGYQLGFRCAK